MSSKTAKLWNIVFIGIIVLIPVSYMFLGSKLNTSNTENRTLAEFPTLETTPWDRIPQGISDYIDDHFPYKSAVVSARGLVERDMLNTASNRDVILGRDGWMFYRGEDNNSYYQYKRITHLSQAELETIAMHLNELRSRAESNGARFIFYIVPNKETVYSEYMPGNIAVADGSYNTDELVAFLREYTDIEVIYCREALEAAKAYFGTDTNLYYRLDTHWNELGAYSGLMPLMEALNVPMRPIDEISIEYDPYSPRDMASLLGLSEQLSDMDNGYVVTDYADDFEIITEETDGLLEYRNTGKDPRRVMFLRDSFTLQLRRFVADSFDYCYLQHHNTFEIEQIDAVQPDVFVYELSERRIGDLLAGVY